MRKYWKKGAAALLSAVLSVSGVFSSVVVYADEDLASAASVSEVTGAVSAGEEIQTATASSASSVETAAEAVSEATGSDALFDEDGVLMDGVVSYDLEATVSDALLLADGKVTTELEEEETEFVLEEVEDGIDGDALFAEYVDRLFSAEEPNRRVLLKSIKYGTRLTGANLTLYQDLSAGFKEIADGNRESTSFTFTMEELGFEEKYYTATELGLNGLSAGGKLTADALNALWEEYGIDLDLVMSALRNDEPYNLYWSASSYQKGYAYSSYKNSSGEITSTRFTQITVVRLAGKTFQGSDSSEVDTAKTSAAKAAKDNADAIITSYKGDSDLQKLIGYRDEIMGLVEYNDDAADRSQYYLDNRINDPWQMIYVFDNDSGTDVVCEGYSKAFKYLCDNTAFNDKSISCYIMTGIFYNTNGSGGGHMWNAVRFGEDDDAVSYLADITHCDSLSSPAARFLVGVDEVLSSDTDGAYGFEIDGRTYDYRQTYSDGSEERSMFELYTNEERTLSESDYHFPVELMSVNTDGTTGIATLQGGGTVYPSLLTGESTVMAIAPGIDGYRFLGWYSEEAAGGSIANAALLSGTASGNIPVLGKGTVYAVYESIDGVQFSLTVNGENITATADSVTEAVSGTMNFDPGTEITLQYTGNQFFRWSTAQGVLLSTQNPYTFTITGNTVISLESADTEDGISLVRFVTSSGQTIYSGYWTAENAAEKYAVVSLDVPQIAGKTFTGWSMTSDEVIAAIRNSQSVITVEPQYTDTDESCTVLVQYSKKGTGTTIRIDGFNGTQYTGTVGGYLTLSAQQAGGYYFYGWAMDPEGTEVLSYSASYRYGVTGKTTIYAVYCDSSEESVLLPVISIEANGSAGEGENLRYVFTFRLDVPTGYEILDAGVIYDNLGRTSLEEADFSLEGEASRASFGIPTAGSFTARVLDKGSGVVVRGYLQVTGTYGTQTIYTDILSSGNS